MTQKNGNPWLFVPALYFLEGIPYFMVSTVSVTMFKRLGVSNAEIGLWTSLITWPWIMKMLWGPLVEAHSTKRKWILGTQFFAVAMLILEAFAIIQPSFLSLTLVVLTILAFLSATHDIAADGFYLLSLHQDDQAYFVGIRATAYRMANIFCNGALIYLAGQWEISAAGALSAAAPSPATAEATAAAANAAPIIGPQLAPVWQKVILCGAGVYALMALIGYFAMPVPKRDQSAAASGFPFKEAFAEYFSQKKLGIILGFILLYRFGESMVSKMSTPFLLDTLEKGGMGVATSDVGFITGVVGVIALTLGGIIGGFVIARFGIKRSLWPMVLAMNVPNLLYIWAAFTHPEKSWVALIVGIDQFGYGFGFAAYMVYMMFITQGSRFPTAHYAISTGLMAFGAMGAGIASGFIQETVGYAGFFLSTLICALPGMLLLLVLPLDKEDLHICPVEVD
jgi:PAT family beta-lactamase induction signal transducer AmpG